MLLKVSSFRTGWLSNKSLSFHIVIPHILPISFYPFPVLPYNCVAIGPCYRPRMLRSKVFNVFFLFKVFIFILFYPQLLFSLFLLFHVLFPKCTCYKFVNFYILSPVQVSAAVLYVAFKNGYPFAKLQWTCCCYITWGPFSFIF